MMSYWEQRNKIYDNCSREVENAKRQRSESMRRAQGERGQALRIAAFKAREYEAQLKQEAWDKYYADKNRAEVDWLHAREAAWKPLKDYEAENEPTHYGFVYKFDEES